MPKPGLKEFRELFYVDECHRVRYKEDAPQPKRGRKRKPHRMVDGNINNKGYRFVAVWKDGRQHMVLAHRIIYALKRGYLPETLDHIDCNPLNNNPSNLRPCSHRNNLLNQKGRIEGQQKGVSWNRNAGKWQVIITVAPYKQKFIGLFNILEFANLVAQEAIEKYHGEYSRW